MRAAVEPLLTHSAHLTSLLPLLHAAVNDMVNALDGITAQGPVGVDMNKVLQQTTMQVIRTSALGVPLGGHGGM